MEQHMEQGAGGKWVREEGGGIYIQGGREGGRAGGTWHILHIGIWNSLVSIKIHISPVINQERKLIIWCSNKVEYLSPFQFHSAYHLGVKMC